MKDYLVRIIAKDSGVRGFAVVTTNLSREAAQRHKTQPTATAVLARALTGATLMGALLKIQQRVALKFAGDGPLGNIVVESDSYGKTRGYVAEPAVDLPRDFTGVNVGTAVGSGTLMVVKDVRLPKLHQGVVPLVTGEIDKDIELYLNQSEQIPSFVSVGALLNNEGGLAVSGGMLLQSLPEPQTSVIHELVERMQELPPVVDMLQDGDTPENVLATVFAGIPYKTLETRPLAFQCKCSLERSEGALLSLNVDDLEGLIEDGEAIIDCHFCHQQYRFDTEDLEGLLAKVKARK